MPPPETPSWPHLPDARSRVPGRRPAGHLVNESRAADRVGSRVPVIFQPVGSGSAIGAHHAVVSPPADRGRITTTTTTPGGDPAVLGAGLQQRDGDHLHLSRSPQ